MTLWWGHSWFDPMVKEHFTLQCENTDLCCSAMP
jgi:hypothetical protein